MWPAAAAGNRAVAFHGTMPLVHSGGGGTALLPHSGLLPRMAIDTYAPCPGGTGKKIKFCCADLVGDLEQLDRLIEGDQVSAALDQVRRLAEKHPGRACLMATRTKLELGTKQFTEAATSSRAFLDAFPGNPLALGQAAVTDALAGRMQEAAALFDKAREAASSETIPELVRVAATLVQAAAQLGHIGFAQGVVDWITEVAPGDEEERRLLAAIVASSGVPAALRTKMHLDDVATDTPWLPDFRLALDHARHWRLARALTAFSSLKAVAGDSAALWTNIAVLCEMLARPFEASEAWLAVARLPEATPDDAVESTGRAMALETEADPDRSPLIRVASRGAVLRVPAGEEGSAAIDLLEDTIRHDARCEPAAFDRSAWVARNAAPPRSVWRVYETAPGDGRPARLLASLLVFARQTDREPEAVLQGFGPDVDAATPIAAALLGCEFGAEAEAGGMPTTTPTNWLLGSQFRMQAPSTRPPAAPPGEPSAFDLLMQQQRDALWTRFLQVWPDTPLPELLGKTPRQALADKDAARRVEALVTEGEATSRRRDAADAWAEMRGRLGLAPATPITAAHPLDEVPPLRWHRLDLQRLDLDQLRGVFVTALDAGFERAAERAAEALLARPEASPEERWESLGLLEDRALSSVRKLEILTELRGLAATLKANDGMLDVTELRVRMQRGDEAESVRLLEHLRRDHGRDQRVLQALAEVLMEAGVDLSAVAGRAAGPGMTPTAAAATSAGSDEAGRIWTPGGEQAGPSGEKKVIWTPG